MRGLIRQPGLKAQANVICERINLLRGLLKQELDESTYVSVCWKAKPYGTKMLFFDNTVERAVNKNKLLIFSCWHGNISCSPARLDLHPLLLLARNE